MSSYAWYSDYITIERNQLVRVVVAHPKNGKSFKCYKEYENGKIIGRNLFYNYFARLYTVDVPGVTYEASYSREKYVAVLEKYERYNTMNMSCTSSPLDTERIIKQRPELRYFINKYVANCEVSCKSFMLLLTRYKEDNSIERLIELNLLGIAIDKRLLKFTPKKKKDVYNYIRINIDGFEYLNSKKDWWNSPNISLSLILSLIKLNMKFYDYIKYYSFCETHTNSKVYDMELFSYLKRKDIDGNDYKIYSRLLRLLKYDYTSIYFKYPNNFNKMLERMKAEDKNVIDSKNYHQRKKLKIITDSLELSAKKNGDYTIYVPSSIEQIESHGIFLHQCLLHKDYVHKIVEQVGLLFFIEKNGIPYATAFVDYDGEIKEFYTSQENSTFEDRTECTPSDTDVKIFKMFLSEIKLKKVKLVYKYKYVKAFASAKGDSFFGWKNYEFKLGGVHSTGVDDNVILKEGVKCNMTDKVFHFCDNINEIDRHYGVRDIYCEVEPRGPIINAGGALLTNKLKIVRQLNVEEIKELRSYGSI